MLSRCVSTYSRTSRERCACSRSQMISNFLPIVTLSALRNSMTCGVQIVPGTSRK